MNDTAPTNDHDMLVEMNANVKNLTSNLQAYTISSNQITQDHEHRLRLMESEQSNLRGAQRALKNIGAIISILLTLATVVVGIVSTK